MKIRNILLCWLILGLILNIPACVQYIPNESLNGKIVTDENGKKIKLEWQVGRGENWRFLEEVMVVNGVDTTTEWRYMN